MEIIEECDGYPHDGAIERDIEPVSVDDISSDCGDNLDHESYGYRLNRAANMKLVSLSADDICDENDLDVWLASEDGKGYYDEYFPDV